MDRLQSGGWIIQENLCFSDITEASTESFTAPCGFSPRILIHWLKIGF